MNIPNNISQFSEYAQEELQHLYNPNEIKCLCNIIFLDVLCFTNIDIYLQKNKKIKTSLVETFINIIQELKQGRPIQYIIGETEFAGLKFYLNKDTLIPRPETYELIDWVKTFATDSKKIIDIGTGSGVIAITLAHLCPDTIITAIDISKEACEITKRNAIRNQVKINIQEADILNWQNKTWNTYDIIVSNPPYIKEEEKQEMEDIVLLHEPHRALFVSNDDPLIFYRKIAEFGQEHLTSGGYIFFEINQALAKEMFTLMQNLHYTEIEIKKDIYGNNRMLKAKRTINN